MRRDKRLSLAAHVVKSSSSRRAATLNVACLSACREIRSIATFTASNSEDLCILNGNRIEFRNFHDLHLMMKITNQIIYLHKCFQSVTAILVGMLQIFP